MFYRCVHQNWQSMNGTRRLGCAQSRQHHTCQTLAINLEKWQELDSRAAKATDTGASRQLHGKLAQLERRLEAGGRQQFCHGKTATAPSAPQRHYDSRNKHSTRACGRNLRVKVGPASSATLPLAPHCGRDAVAECEISLVTAPDTNENDCDVIGGGSIDEADEVQLCEALATSKAALLAQIDMALQRPTRLDNGMDMVVTNFLAARREPMRSNAGACAVPHLWDLGYGNSASHHGNALAPELALGTARDSKGRALPQPSVSVVNMARS